jgi:NSS family neurotransmitter:Na+ symporter
MEVLAHEHDRLRDGTSREGASGIDHATGSRIEVYAIGGNIRFEELAGHFGDFAPLVPTTAKNSRMSLRARTTLDSHPYGGEDDWEEGRCGDEPCRLIVDSIHEAEHPFHFPREAFCWVKRRGTACSLRSGFVRARVCSASLSRCIARIVSGGTMASAGDDSREQWQSRTGFLLAAVGSAVGLGNMWRFSYLAAEKGGAGFVALYLLFTVLLGLPVMLAELTIGRGARRGPISALAHYGGPRWRWLGGFFVIAGFLILSYYGVIGGWTLRYAFEAAVVGFPADAGAHFNEIASGFDSLGTQILFMILTIVIVSRGIGSGIERVARIAMPSLFVVMLGLVMYASTLEGAEAGYAYYLNFDLEKAMKIDVVVAAAGQAFFSLSLGMGAILTFASYLPKDSNLARESVVISLTDFGVAFIAGLMVFPLIFALGMQNEISGGTVGALFVALPKAFASMGGVGRIVGGAFFVALVVGALTSAISLLEVIVSAIMDALGWERRRATVVSGLFVTIAGAWSAFDLEILDLADSIATNVFLVGGGLAIAIFVGWVMEDPAKEASVGSVRSGLHEGWRFALRYIVPVALVTILWSSLPETWAKFLAVAGLD